ncbi:MAG: SAM-dependent methyltransferase [Myxococcota bacterium]
MTDIIADRWRNHRYPRYAHDCTHPSRLRTAAAWFGLSAPETATATVLELGCAVGDNLIPIAARNPQGTFVGVDLNPDAIALGQGIIADLGLTNITLMAGDIRAIPIEGPAYDYIIAHGLYSWVPPKVQQHILALFASRLSDNGVAHISYNALPGWRLWGVFREMLLERFSHIADPFVQAEHALDYLEWLDESQDGGDSWWATAVKSQNMRSKVGGLSNMAHDQLSPVMQPLWNREFAEHLAPHGLAWMGQVDVEDNFVAARPADTWELIDGVVDRIERATLLDSVVGRTFSHVVVCRDHHEISIPHVPFPGAFWSARLSLPDDMKLDTAEAVNVKTVDGPEVEVQSRLYKETLRALGLGQPVTIEQLAVHLREHVGAEFVSDSDIEEVQKALFQWAKLGVVRADVEPGPIMVELEGTPVIERLVRHAAQGKHPVVGDRHNMIDLDDVDRLLLPMLDGEHDLYDVARVLETRLGEGPIGGVKENMDMPPAGPERMALAAAVLRARCRAWRVAGLIERCF